MIQNLRLLRKEKGISQQELADALGTNQQSINAYENRKSQPDIEMLMKIADYFNTSVDFLVGYKEIQDSRRKLISADELRFLETYKLLPEPLQNHIRNLVIENVRILNSFHQSESKDKQD